MGWIGRVKDRFNLGGEAVEGQLSHTLNVNTGAELTALTACKQASNP